MAEVPAQRRLRRAGPATLGHVLELEERGLAVFAMEERGIAMF
jgi:hypothetical protein